MPTQPLLDLSSLKQATAFLEEVVGIYQKDAHNALIRDAMIQRF